MGEGVGVSGGTVTVPLAELDGATAKELLEGESCRCVDCDALKEISPAQAVREDCSTKIIIQVECKTLPFVRPEAESSSSTSTSSSTASTSSSSASASTSSSSAAGTPSEIWKLDVSSAGRSAVPHAENVTLEVSDEELTLNLGGRRWKFHGFEQTAKPLGAMKASPNFELHYTEGGDLDTIKRPSGYSGGGPGEEYHYARIADGPNAGLVESVTLKRDIPGNSLVNISRVEFEYFTTDGDFGEVGDLWAKRSLVWDPNEGTQGGWVQTKAAYFGYYTTSGAVRFVLGERQYLALLDDLGQTAAMDFNQLAAAQSSSSSSSSSDPLAAIQARSLHEYTYHNDKIASQKVHGGQRTYEFEFSENADWIEGTNHWFRYGKETLKNNQGQAVRVKEHYTNHQGQPLLTKITADGKTWWEYVEYGEDIEKGSFGQVTLHARPSALASCSVGTNVITPTYNESGLVRLYEYYDETTATVSQAGAAKGLRRFEKLRCGGPAGAVSTLKERVYRANATPPTAFVTASVSDFLAPDNKIETQFEYVWDSGESTSVLEHTVHYPDVPESQNGPGGTSGAQRTERFDEAGRVVWLRDERGRVTYHEYDGDRNVRIRTIRDVNSSHLPAGVSLPAGWPDNTDALNLQTDTDVDNRGRVLEVLGPAHKVDQGGSEKEVRTARWFTHDLHGRRVISARGFKEVGSGQITVVNPVAITTQDERGQVADEIQAVRSTQLEHTRVSVDESFDDQTQWCRWTRHQLDVWGRETATRVYHDIPASGTGQVGADQNYNETTSSYDWADRQYKQTSAGGTITWTVFDSRGRVMSVYLGDDDTLGSASDPTNGGANHMRLVKSHEYDGGGAGDGNLTKLILPVDDNVAHNREHNLTYDFRNRTVRETLPPDDAGKVTYSLASHDNLNRVVRVEQYLVDNSGDVLLARNETDYDDRGQAWRTRIFSVNDGAAGNNVLVGHTWRDAAGNVIKEQSTGSAVFRKTMYDGVARPVKTFAGCDPDEPIATTGTHAAASSVDDDLIVQQTNTDYDAAGHMVKNTSFSRKQTSTATGELNANEARSGQEGHWFDGVGRMVGSADFGVGMFDRTTQTMVPARSDSVLVTTVEYDDRGDPHKTVDAAGREERVEFDDAGQQIRSTQNWIDGNPATGGSDEDVTLQATYTADGQVATVTSKNPDTGDQVATYVYGTDKGGIVPQIYHTGLLRAVIYPDSDDPADLGGSTYDRVEYEYNRQGELVVRKDQNGTVHTLTFDKLGRPTSDAVTLAPGSNIDSRVLRIDRKFDVLGSVEKVTSYDSAELSSASVVNEVEFSYNGFGQSISERQEHDGAVATVTPQVGYTYGDGTFGHTRLSEVTYPNGRRLHYGSDPGADEDLGRVSWLADDNGYGGAGTRLASFTYMGTGQVVRTDYEEPHLRFDLDHGTAGTYAGLDPFGRVAELLWHDYAAGQDAVRIEHGYDRQGNRTYRLDEVSASHVPPLHLDEIYGYDGVDRLATTDRGDVNENRDGLVAGTKNFAQQWDIDPAANWNAFKQDVDGSGWDLEQTRDHNQGNEITDIDETTGASWMTPAHDKAGNLTVVPQPRDATKSFQLTWDAWNRLVRVADGTQTVAQYEYDGRDYRTVKKTFVDGELDETRHFYWSGQGQVLEERVGVSSVAERQYVWGLRYVDDLLLRDRNADADPETGDWGCPGSGLEERRYSLQDANFNVVALADEQGDVVERYIYSGYGEAAVFDGDWSSSGSESATDNGYLFTGRYRDAETGLYYYRARYYAPHLGRFLARDPMGVVGAANHYAYCAASPATNVDPYGLFEFEVIGTQPDLSQPVADPNHHLGSLQITVALTNRPKVGPRVWWLRTKLTFREYAIYTDKKKCFEQRPHPKSYLGIHRLGGTIGPRPRVGSTVTLFTDIDVYDSQVDNKYLDDEFGSLYCFKRKWIDLEYAYLGSGALRVNLGNQFRPPWEPLASSPQMAGRPPGYVQLMTQQEAVASAPANLRARMAAYWNAVWNMPAITSIAIRIDWIYYNPRACNCCSNEPFWTANALEQNLGIDLDNIFDNDLEDQAFEEFQMTVTPAGGNPVVTGPGPVFSTEE